MISKEHAVEIAVAHASELQLAEFTVGAAWLIDDEDDGQNWNVQLEFVSEPNDGFLGLPTHVNVHVDASSGKPWTIKSL